MKKILAILSLVVVFSIACGCVSTVTEVKGTVYNRVDERVVVYIENKVTEQTSHITMANESSRSATLEVGDYSVWAYNATYPGWENVDYIGGAELEIRATDTSFTITVYNDSLRAESY